MQVEERRDIPASLTACFGPGQIRRGRPEDEVDGLVPAMALTVRDAREVASVIGEAASHGLGLIASGGGTSLVRGRRPKRYDIRLSMRGMAAITELGPADMTVTAEAGLTLAGLNRRLAEHGQRLALDPELPERRTLGGLAAEGFAGGLSHGFGGIRDLVLGLSVVDGKGRALKTGGRVVKNVAGYDLPRLFVGSAGTLGVITELTLRTHPLPEAAATLVFDAGSTDELAEMAAVLEASPLPLAALDLSHSEAKGDQSLWRLHLRIEGNQEQLRYQWACLGEVAGAVPSEQLSTWSSPAVVHPTDTVVVTCVVKPAETTALASHLAAAGRQQHSRIGGHLGSGKVLVALTDRPAPGQAVDKEVEWINSMRRAAGERGAKLQVEKCSAAAKEKLDVWALEPEGSPSANLMAEIKRRFDPDGVLSPGRFVTNP